MSVASELQDLQTYLSNAYDKIEDKGGTIPQNKNMYNLADAIDSITSASPIIIPPSAGTLSSISVTTPPTKTSYYEGEYFDYSGCVVMATYTNGYFDVTNSCTFVCNVPLQFGDSSVSVKYENKTTTIAISVSAVPVPAPSGTKLLMHLNGNLKNEVTNDTTGISGTFVTTTGKFEQGHSSATEKIYMTGFQPSSGFTNYGIGWWGYVNNDSSLVTRVGAKLGGAFNNRTMVCYSQSGKMIMRPDDAAFSYSNLQIHEVVSTTQYSWHYYAFQIKNNRMYCYVDGTLVSECNITAINCDLSELCVLSGSDYNTKIDEIIIAENDIYQKNNSEWTIVNS